MGQGPPDALTTGDGEERDEQPATTLETLTVTTATFSMPATTLGTLTVATTAISVPAGAHAPPAFQAVPSATETGAQTRNEDIRSVAGRDMPTDTGTAPRRPSKKRCAACSGRHRAHTCGLTMAKAAANARAGMVAKEAMKEAAAKEAAAKETAAKETAAGEMAKEAAAKEAAKEAAKFYHVNRSVTNGASCFVPQPKRPKHPRAIQHDAGAEPESEKGIPPRRSQWASSSRHVEPFPASTQHSTERDGFLNTQDMDSLGFQAPPAPAWDGFLVLASGQKIGMIVSDSGEVEWDQHANCPNSRKCDGPSVDDDSTRMGLTVATSNVSWKGGTRSDQRADEDTRRLALVSSHAVDACRTARKSVRRGSATNEKFTPDPALLSTLRTYHNDAVGHGGCTRLEADVRVAYAKGHLSEQPGNLRAHVRWFVSHCPKCRTLRRPRLQD